jgi:thimet oligopeptidase
VWDKAVKAFDVVDAVPAHDEKAVVNGAPNVVGRIYLDMHPREGKSKWFSECSLVGGVRGRQMPEASLVCNFPEPTKDDPGLMQYSDVVTYFHEFGHLMHEVLGGRQRWAGQSGIATEGDFVEVPSQMLEEFFEDAELLQTFAKHYQTGEPIPRRDGAADDEGQRAWPRAEHADAGDVCELLAEYARPARGGSGPGCAAARGL